MSGTGKRKEKNGTENGVRKSGLEQNRCVNQKRCGSCRYLSLTYEQQLAKKEEYVRKSLEKGLVKRVMPVIGMDDPYHYRNKVTAVFARDRKGNPVSGVYEGGTHHVLPVEECLIEDALADKIIGTIRGMLKSFKIWIYDEDTRRGLLRYVLVRRGFTTGQVMVVLVTASPVFPSKKNFVQALLREHPEITTVVQNINPRTDSLILGDRQQVLYGKGYIEDVLCGCTFRISPSSFYQINPVQTEKLYGKAIELAALTGKEKLIDAYCGIGTIGLIAASRPGGRKAGSVLSIELNPDAVRDAIHNAKLNQMKNARFYCNDAGRFMNQMASGNASADVVFMDPPRSGSTEEFIHSIALLGPKTVVYVSCNPETLVRDLAVFQKAGYRAKEAWAVDMFPWVPHCEVCVKLERKY